MRIKIGCLILLALAGVSQSSLARTITLGGYEPMSRPVEVSRLPSGGTVTISAGADISLGSGVSGHRETIVSSLGGDIQLDSSQPILVEGSVADSAMVTLVPEPESYAMLLAGLGLLGVVVRRRKQ